MQNGNFHTHTKRCGHAIGEDEHYVKAAIAAGMSELGFSEHVGYPCVDKPGERMLYRDTQDYLASVSALKEKYKDEITVYVGFEIEYYKDQIDFLRTLRKECDYMIVGQHCRTVYGDGYDEFCDDEGVLLYAKQLCNCMRSGLVSLVAHPDYFMLGRRSFSAACALAAHEICACAVECNIPLEINLNGLRYGKLLYEPTDAYAYPYRAFWEIAAQYPIQCIYGYDAHQPTTLLEKKRIAQVKEILADLPLTMIDTILLK